MTVTAHRGARAEMPENTMAAFLRASELGVDGIELDIHASRDGALVVIHDPRVDRTTDGSGTVSELDWAEIAALDAGGGARVPRLEDVFAGLADTRMEIQIEVKAAGAAVGLRALVERSHAWRDRIVISSFDAEIVASFARWLPEVRRGLIAHGYSAEMLETAVGLGCDFVYPGWPDMDAAAVAACRDAGVQPVVWLVNDDAAWRRAREIGVTGVSTDDPALCLALRDDEGGGDRGRGGSRLDRLRRGELIGGGSV